TPAESSRVLQKAPRQREQPCPRGSVGGVGAKTPHPAGCRKHSADEKTRCFVQTGGQRRCENPSQRGDSSDRSRSTIPHGEAPRGGSSPLRPGESGAFHQPCQASGAPAPSTREAERALALALEMALRRQLTPDVIEHVVER